MANFSSKHARLFPSSLPGVSPLSPRLRGGKGPGDRGASRLPRRLPSAFAIFALLLGLYQPANGQANTTLTYDQAVTGHITNAAFRVVYTFTGRAADVIDLTLSRTDGNLDPVLVLTDDQNNVLAISDDGGDSFDASILSEQLPRDGTYFVIATRFGQERGLTTGGYSLLLSHVGSTSVSNNVALRYGDSIVAEITNQQVEIVYAFRASRGDVIHIAMQRISGDLDSYLILADVQGNILQTNDEDPANPGTLDAGINNLRIEKTGTYILVATRFGRQSGTSQGSFTLTLDQIPLDMLGKTPDKAILIDYGSSTPGQISDSLFQRYYLIEVHRGDVIEATVERTKGNLDPTLTLYSLDNKELATNDAGQHGQEAKISAFTAPADGSYVLMVSRFNADKGLTAGDYTLTLTGLHGVLVNPKNKTPLDYNSAASALIDDTNFMQQYIFTGVKGDVVTVTMNATSGDLQVQLILLDPNGKIVMQDASGTRTAKLQSIKLTQSGTFTIIATRYGRDKGTSRGTYALTLTAANH